MYFFLCSLVYILKLVFSVCDTHFSFSNLDVCCQDHYLFFKTFLQCLLALTSNLCSVSCQFITAHFLYNNEFYASVYRFKFKSIYNFLLHFFKTSHFFFLLSIVNMHNMYIYILL